MNTKFTYLIIAFALLLTNSANAQSYTPNVSKDSLTVLKDRGTALKASLKIHELKIKESEEETDVEKLRIKLLKANEKAKASAAENNEVSKKLSTGSLDSKTIQKIAQRAKDDMSDSQKALDSYHKQIRRVESIRSEIRIEEGKVSNKKPTLIFNHN
ncbi:MAG: hypothetical protein V4663_01770 [Bacteroidota bacterium]